MAKKKLYSFRFDEDFIKQLQKLADKDSRSLTNYFEVLGKKAIEDSKKKKRDVQQQ